MADFATGMMGGARSSANVVQGQDDALLRFLLGAEAFMPDDMRAQQGRAALTEQDRDAAFRRLNDRGTYVDPGADVLGVGRVPPVGPSHPKPPTPEMLAGLVSGQPPAPSFRQQSDDALFAQGIGDLLAGRQQSPDQFVTALESAGGGPIDWALIARLYGQQPSTPSQGPGR